MQQVNRWIDYIAANKKYHFGIFLVILLVLTCFMMASYHPLCPGQDFHFHFRRLNALMEALANGTFPSYTDYGAVGGYGYLTKAFYCDFVLIPFAAIGLFTDAVVAYQLIVLTSTMLCGIFTYRMVNTIYRNTFAAFAAAILYTFCIYRLLDLYHRAALGEAISFTFIPLVLLGMYHIIKGNYRKWYMLAIGFSLMLMTHLISTLLMAITLIIIAIIYYKPLLSERKRIIYLLLAAGVTVIISSYYLLPMLEQMTSGTFYYNTQKTMAFAQESGLGLHWIVWGLFSGLVHPAQVFVPGTGILLTCVIILRVFVQGKSSLLRSADIAVAIGVFYLFASSELFPWSIFPFNQLNFIQLPWRLYEFSSLFFAVAGAYYLSLMVQSNKRAAIVGSIIVVATMLMIASDARLYKEVRCYRNIIEEASIENDYQLGGYEYVPAKVPSIEAICKRGDRVGRYKETTEIRNYKREREMLVFDIETNNTDDILELPLFYYKGYKATLNRQEIAVKQSEHGLVEIPVHQSGRVEVYYAGTTVQRVSFYITVASILILCVYLLIERRRKVYHHLKESEE